MDTQNQQALIRAGIEKYGTLAALQRAMATSWRMMLYAQKGERRFSRTRLRLLAHLIAEDRHESF